jgi:hypothetical protein
MSMEPPAGGSELSGWAAGWIAFAGAALIMIGIFHAIAGFAQIMNEESFLVTAEYVFKFSTVTWGWIHLIGGIVVVFAGFAVFRGAVWARTVGVIIAMFSAILNFAWLVYVPFWSIVMIIVDVSVIWALTVHGRDLATMSES